MAGTSLCAFCQTPDGVDAMKVYDNCDILDGDACTACKDYMALEVKISEAKHTLNDLLVQRLKIRSRVNENHDLLTKNVPVEIICSVFQLCAPPKWSFDDFRFSKDDDPMESKLTELRMVSGPLLLGSICRTWRNIAWTIEPLWTTFRLHIDHIKNANIVSLTREWLERAGKMPVSISISSTTDFSLIEAEAELATQLAAIINERSNQWESLDIVGSTSWISQIKGSSGGAPNLQALRIGVSTATRLDEEEFSLTDLKPRPLQLRLHNYELNLIHIEWDHLTYVSFSNQSLDDGVELLQRASNLVYCRFYSICWDVSNFPIPKKGNFITYQTLRSLEFDCPDESFSQAREIIRFLQSFSFPNLEHLKIKAGGTREDAYNHLSWGPVVAHLEKFAPPLISLGIKLFGPHTIKECIIPILKMAPSLCELEIMAPFDEEWDRQENEFLQLLADTSLPDDTKPNFLPNLQSIEFYLGPEHDPVKFWNAIPGIFGPISDIHNPHRRPLKALQVRVETKTPGLDDIDIKSSAVVLQLLRLQNEGILLDLKDVDEQADVLQQSLELDASSSFEDLLETDHRLAFESV